MIRKQSPRSPRPRDKPKAFVSLSLSPEISKTLLHQKTSFNSLLPPTSHRSRLYSLGMCSMFIFYFLFLVLVTQFSISLFQIYNIPCLFTQISNSIVGIIQYLCVFFIYNSYSISKFSSIFILLYFFFGCVQEIYLLYITALTYKMPSAQDPFYVVKEEIQESVSFALMGWGLNFFTI